MANTNNENNVKLQPMREIPNRRIYKAIPLAFDESLSWLEELSAILYKLNETIEQVNTNTDNIETNRQNIETNRQNIETNKNNIETNRVNIAKNKESIDLINNTITEMKEVEKDLQSQITSNDNDILALQNRCTTIENNITTIQNNISTITSDLSSLTDRVGTNETNISDLQTKLSTLSGNLTTTNETITNLQNEIDKTNTKVDTNTNDISELKTSVSDLNSKLGSVSGDVETELNKKIETITTTDNQNLQVKKSGSESTNYNIELLSVNNKKGTFTDSFEYKNIYNDSSYLNIKNYGYLILESPYEYSGDGGCIPLNLSDKLVYVYPKTNYSRYSPRAPKVSLLGNKNYGFKFSICNYISSVTGSQTEKDFDNDIVLFIVEVTSDSVKYYDSTGTNLLYTGTPILQGEVGLRVEFYLSTSTPWNSDNITSEISKPIIHLLSVNNQTTETDVDLPQFNYSISEWGDGDNGIQSLMLARRIDFNGDTLALETRINDNTNSISTINTTLANKQDKLSAGYGISITDNTISVSLTNAEEVSY